MKLRELRYRIYGEDRLSGKLDTIGRSANRTNAALNKTSGMFSGLKSKTSSAAAEIPLLSRSLALVKNPAVMAAGGLALVGKAAWDASQAAVDFNASFRELSNLNLDRPRAEVNNLREEVLSLSAKKKFDAGMTSQGFYDVQSVTGKTGFELKNIVGKQGEFAKLVNADFNKWIEGSAKAMANYGFGADQLDRFNNSAFATVKVGSISFDQLSKVQADYAGAAASAKQSYESANKLLTLFTVKTKSADEAATLTKSAFTDLFKASTIEAFENAGIRMYDTLTGGHRQVDEIMKDLNKRFMEAKNDQEVDALRNKFAGSEGLTALIQTAADQSGNFLNTLEAFNNVKFNYGKALKEARKDVAFLQKETLALINTTRIQLGQEMIPLRLDLEKFKLGLAGDANETIQWIRAIKKVGLWNAKDYINEQSGFKELGNSIRKGYMDEIGKAKSMTFIQYGETRKGLKSKLDEANLNLSSARGYNNPVAVSDYSRAKGLSISEAKEKMEKKARLYMEIVNAYSDVLSQFEKARAGRSGSMPGGAQAGGEGNGNGSNSSPDPSISKGLSEISGGGQAVKSISVDFKSLVENFTVQTNTINESAPDVERKITEFLIRAIGGAEQLLNQN